ncbi:FAD-dependent oxidoreductase [Nonomuraea africana]|uniref:2-polyprenyl-6-methoxyphenol hydroxylase-like FAD-dependent oxidoreductase n=1 Tax=Nonomuraea africana TaxID=46171 RepID=A0ABR9KCE2_9ACTN|nr:FAD-dependent oxidoreductase [Nonomuraea africana]MBE1559500.1 2-polyprenyl-6-methoxyphenol hydroxylase-like FAD-dependent oxidoreductase [Nonomuraea africana]
MKTLICGAGIAGLTLAWHLERSGWDVELVERAARFRDGGYLIDFYGPGLEVAERMGLRGRLEAQSYTIEGLTYRDERGRASSRLDMPGDFAQLISLLRGDLAAAVLSDVRAPIRYGTSVAAVEERADGVTVTLTDGSRREVDLLVGADGAHSRVRDLVFGREEEFVRYLGHHIAVFLLTDKALNAAIGRRYQALTVPGRSAGAYALRDDALATMFLRREPDPALPVDPAESLRRHFGELGWLVPGLLAHCPDDPAEIFYDQVVQIEMDRWSRGRVVLLGDACQAVSLFAGHGSSVAMAAAWVLADELRGAGDRLSTALAAYEDRMRPTIERTQALGRRVVDWMAPSTRWRIGVRDGLLRLATLPGISRLLLNSLTPGTHSLAGRRPTELRDLAKH